MIVGLDIETISSGNYRFDLLNDKSSIEYPAVQVSDTTGDAIYNFSWATIKISCIVKRF